MGSRSGRRWRLRSSQSSGRPPSAVADNDNNTAAMARRAGVQATSVLAFIRAIPSPSILLARRPAAARRRLDASKRRSRETPPHSVASMPRHATITRPCHRGGAHRRSPAQSPRRGGRRPRPGPDVMFRFSEYHNRPPPPTPALPPPAALAPVAAAPEALVLSGGWQIEGLPAMVLRAGPQAAERTVEFFTPPLRLAGDRAGGARQPGRLGARADTRRQDGQDAGAAARRSAAVCWTPSIPRPSPACAIARCWV